MKFRNLVMCALAIVLAGCIEVDDLGGMWGKGRVDPALEGRWLMHPVESIVQDVGDTYYIFEKAGDHYRVKAQDSEPEEYMLAQTLDIGGQTFLMLREGEKTNGDLWRYNLTGGRLEFSRIIPSHAEAVSELSDGKISPRRAGDYDLFAVGLLDEAALEAIGRVGAYPAHWETWISGTRDE